MVRNLRLLALDIFVFNIIFISLLSCALPREKLPIITDGRHASPKTRALYLWSTYLDITLIRNRWCRGRATESSIELDSCSVGNTGGGDAKRNVHFSTLCRRG